MALSPPPLKNLSVGVLILLLVGGKMNLDDNLTTNDDSDRQIPQIAITFEQLQQATAGQ